MRAMDHLQMCVCVCVCSSAVVAAVCVSTVCEFALLKPFSSFFDVLKEPASAEIL